MHSASALRRTVLGLTALVLGALIIYAGYWYTMAARIRDRLVPWAEAQQARGDRLSWDDAAVDGFPGFFHLHFTNPSFGAARPLPVAVSAPQIVARAAPWNLRHWEFSAPSGATLSDALNLAGFTLGRLDGSGEVDDATGLSLDVTALDLAGSGLALGTHVGDAEIHVEVPAAPPASHLDSALDLALQLTDLKLPVAVLGFGDTLSGLSFAAQLKGALPPGPFVQALAAWRDGGGTIELQYFRLRWGALLVDASGTVALDGDLQPEGALSAVITGQDAAVDVAVMTGALKPQEAGAAKAVLGLLGKPQADGEKAITMPLTMQRGKLFLGPAAIAPVPRINW